MKTVLCICHTCGKEFSRQLFQVKGKKFLYCSVPCYRKGKSTEMKSGIYTTGRITDEELIDDLKTLYKKLGHYPRARDINNEFPNRSIKYARRFGSVERALWIAGIDVRQCIIDDIIRVSKQIGFTPTDQQYRQFGIYTIVQVWNRFGSWADACKISGLVPHTTFEGGPHRVPIYRYQRSDGRKTNLQGSYELRFAIALDAIGIKWMAHNEFRPLIYHTQDGKQHKYMPDFYIPEWDRYIETKGWFREKDKEKMAYVYSANPDVNIVVVEKHALKHFEVFHRLP